MKISATGCRLDPDIPGDQVESAPPPKTRAAMGNVPMNILHIDCSPRSESHSRELSAAIIEELLKVAPCARITRRDLGADPLPHATADYAITLSSPATLAAPLEGALDLA